MPPTRKPPAKRQNRVTRSIGPVRSAGRAPRMPAGLCRQAQEAWRGYWSDTVSGVTGSTGQPKGNPLYDTAYRIEASIREDEKQLGIDPLSRLRLGAQLSEAAKTLGEINTEATNAADPRAALTVVAD
jgi:hypothetical protein